MVLGLRAGQDGEMSGQGVKLAVLYEEEVLESDTQRGDCS